MEPKFCRVCGKECIEVETNYDYPTKEYDENTGQLIMRYKCPTGICKHEGCYHNYVTAKWWHNFVGKRTCLNCGTVQLGL